MMSLYCGHMIRSTVIPDTLMPDTFDTNILRSDTMNKVSMYEILVRCNNVSNAGFIYVSFNLPWCYLMGDDY